MPASHLCDDKRLNAGGDLSKAEEDPGELKKTVEKTLPSGAHQRAMPPSDDRAAYRTMMTDAGSSGPLALATIS